MIFLDMKISPWNCNHIQNTVLKPYEQGAQTCYIHEHNSGKNLLVLFFKDFLLGFLVHIVQLQYRELGLAGRGVWLGSNGRPSVLAAWKQPSFFMGELFSIESAVSPAMCVCVCVCVCASAVHTYVHTVAYMD